MDRRRYAAPAALLALLLLVAFWPSGEDKSSKPPSPARVTQESQPPLPSANAAPPPQVSISSSELPSGGFMAVREGVKLGPFVLEHTEVEARVSGAFATVEVSQLYANPHKDRLEAIYTFPLPQNAAVTDMYLRISSRVITSEVREREQAKKIYEEARSSGRTAALLEQERPNIFTQSVANIPPGEKVFVHIKYVHELSYDDGRYRFVFPMVVGPRFIPGVASGGPDTGRGWAQDTERVPDASRITPHPLLPGERSGHDVQVKVDLSPGLPIEGLRSLSHQVKVRRPAPDHARVKLSPADTIPNKDLILEWRLKARQPEIAVLAHRPKEGGEGTLMMLIQPQASFKASEVTPKEMVFVVDTSGSMSGEPIAKVKQAMRRAIMGMNPRDSFQVIRFDDSASQFAPRPLPNTQENVRAALSYINNLNGGGGTNMIEGIKASLDYPKDPGRRRIVFFMTDGYIGNETQILAAIQERLGETRLFSFGVGSSVNHYLLDNMAKVGRGFVQYVRPDEDTAKAVELFYRRIRNPLLMDVKIDWGGLPVTEVFPESVPDLFDSQPLYVFARYAGPAGGTVRLTGKIAGRPYERSLQVKLPAGNPEHALLPRLWARRQIDRLMAGQFGGEKPEIVEKVKGLGLTYKLMTQYTSFVAVERTIRAGVDIPLQTVLIPVEMPEGVSFEGVFGKDAAVVSIPRMKPGDPVLTVLAPPGTVAVIADFPFGKRQLCAFDPRRERWACRFLVPRGTPDGRYPIKITCVGPDGRRTPMEAEFAVDSKAPVFEVAARRVGGMVELVARPREDVLESKAGPRGEVKVVHDVKRLLARASDGRVARFKLDDRPGEFVWRARLKASGSVVVEAVDFAGNISRQTVALP